MIRSFLCVLAVLLAWSGPGEVRAGDDDLEGGTVGTGIMGVITGHGSLHVNGLRVEVPAEMSVASPLGARRASDLAVGETVRIEATRRGETLTAAKITAHHPLVGPVEAMGPGRLRILGVEVAVDGAEITGVSRGDWVAVSGLWRGDTVVASALRRIPPRTEVVISAAFGETANGQRVGPVPLDGRYIRHAAPGAPVMVSGAWIAATGRLQPRRIEIGLFPDALRTLSIEGYLSQPDRRGAYRIYGAGIVAFTEDANMSVPPERSVFCVDRGGTVAIQQALSLGPEAETRRRQLERLARTGGAAGCRAP